MSTKKEKKKYIRLTNEGLRLEALKYKSRIDFEKNSHNAYQAAYRRGMDFLNSICLHMPHIRHGIWTDKELHQEALKYKSRGEFKNFSGVAYTVSRRRSKLFLDKICSHMRPSLVEAWSDEELIIEAKKYLSLTEFQKNGKGAYKASLDRGREFLDKICSHMPSITNTSSSEKELLRNIQEFFPQAKKYRMTKLKIEKTPFIHWFELDIYIPELRKGIEFDGIWSHSFKGLKRGRPHWPDEALANYHEIKDSVFLNKNIQILHIKEEEWKNNQQECIDRCLVFLRGENVEQAA